MRLYVVQAEPITIIMGSPEMFIGMYTYDLNNELIQGMKSYFKNFLNAYSLG